MTDGILRLGTHLCEGHAVGFEGSKDRVVPEAFIPYALPQYRAFHDAFEEHLLVALHKGDDGAEACSPRRSSFKLVKQASYVGIGIVALAIAVHGAEACRIDSRCSVQGVHFQPGVVGKAVHAIVLMDIACLLQSIAFNRVGRFGNVLHAADVAQALHGKGTAQYLSDFLQLVGIVGGHNEFLHNPYIFF